MAQANGLVIRIREDKVDEFEALFASEELPIWEEFHTSGKFLEARISRVDFGTHVREGVRSYLIYVVVPGMADHSAHDDDPRFKAYLEKVKPLWAEEPLVFGGDTWVEMAG